MHLRTGFGKSPSPGGGFAAAASQSGGGFGGFASQGGGFGAAATQPAFQAGAFGSSTAQPFGGEADFIWLHPIVCEHQKLRSRQCRSMLQCGNEVEAPFANDTSIQVIHAKSGSN